MVVWWPVFRLFAFVFVFGFGQCATASEVVSTSLCGDAYVTALSRPGDIKALSWQADGSLSQSKAKYGSLPKARADSEVLLALAASHLVLGPGDGLSATLLAQQRGALVHQIIWSDDFAGIANNITRLGAFLGQEQTAEQFNQTQNRALMELSNRRQNRSRDFSVLYLTPTLGTGGKGSFVDAAIRAAGGTNMASQMGITGWGQVPLEKLAVWQPDLIISSFFKEGPPSVYQFRGRHQLLKTLQNNTPQQHIPGGLWVCAGPDLIKAASLIADALDAIDKGEG